MCVCVCVCKLFEILQEVFKDLKLQYFKFIVYSGIQNPIKRLSWSFY